MALAPVRHRSPTFVPVLKHGVKITKSKLPRQGIPGSLHFAIGSGGIARLNDILVTVRLRTCIFLRARAPRMRWKLADAAIGSNEMLMRV